MFSYRHCEEGVLPAEAIPNRVREIASGKETPALPLAPLRGL